MIQKSGKVITGFRMEEPRVESVSGTLPLRSEHV